MRRADAAGFGRPVARRRSLFRGGAMALAALPAWTCQAAGMLHPRGPVGAAEKTILINSIVIMLAIVVPTILATLAFAWWYRASNERARYRPDWAYSGRIELVVWAVPLLVIISLGGIAWIGSHDLDPAKPLDSKLRPLEVHVVSLDWKWLFIYPEQGVASINQLVIPAGTPVHFTLTSASVMNAFFIPQLGSMIYTMNGMTTQLNLLADRPGDFEGMSSHFSGDGFSGMRFQTRAVPAEGFAAWVQTARSDGPSLDAQSYTVLARQSSDVPPSTFRAVEPHLFDAIATQKIPPSDGPPPGKPSPPGSPGKGS